LEKSVFPYIHLFVFFAEFLFFSSKVKKFISGTLFRAEIWQARTWVGFEVFCRPEKKESFEKLFLVKKLFAFQFVAKVFISNFFCRKIFFILGAISKIFFI
jgi:hypothetical protein